MNNDFEFYTFEKDKDMDLNGSTLFVTRILSRYSNNNIRFENVGIVHFHSDSKKGPIWISIFNTDGDKIAYFDEYKKNKHVALQEVKVFSNLLDEDNEDNDEEIGYDYVVLG